MYKAPLPTRNQTTVIHCDELDDEDDLRHHVYLQSRLEMGSAYVMHVQLGFTTLVVEKGRYRCFPYQTQCPLLAGKLNKASLSSYVMDEDFLRLLVLKRW
jgi:hypothetical protein